VHRRELTSVKTWLMAATLVWAALGASELHAQMMGGGREVRAGRDVMSERLANATPGQRAWLEAVRDERAGFRSVMQRVTLRAGVRSYQLGSAEVTESLAQATYTLRRPRMRLRVAGSLLRFASGDDFSISGLAPLDARLDLAVRDDDSLRVGVRAPSSPMTLSGQQVAALATIGTATVNLSSVELGTPAGVTVRYAHTRPLGAASSLSGTFGIDYEPRPSSSRWSFWRGTTVRAGVRVSGSVGTSQLSAGVDATRSFSDSLSGRNLFQGGGTVLARAGVASYLGDAEAVVLDFSAFYFRPFAKERTDAANRRLPSGDFVGATAIALLPFGGLLATPTLVLSRESIAGAAGTASTSGSGWALGSSLAVDVPLGARLALTPEVGYATGSIRTDFGGGGATDGRGLNESLSGWWFATDLSLSF
jgi:hypothetical protein